MILPHGKIAIQSADEDAGGFWLKVNTGDGNRLAATEKTMQGASRFTVEPIDVEKNIVALKDNETGLWLSRVSRGGIEGYTQFVEARKTEIDEASKFEYIELPSGTLFALRADNGLYLRQDTNDSNLLKADAEDYGASKACLFQYSAV